MTLGNGVSRGDCYRNARLGKLRAAVPVTKFHVDQVTFQYSRAAKELWKFCNLPGARSSITRAVNSTSDSTSVVASAQAHLGSADPFQSLGRSSRYM